MIKNKAAAVPELDRSRTNDTVSGYGNKNLCIKCVRARDCEQRDQDTLLGLVARACPKFREIKCLSCGRLICWDRNPAILECNRFVSLEIASRAYREEIW